jgi:hypothetical protein
MASKKKRNKKYRGRDAVQEPSTIRVKAPERSKLGNWYHDNKQKIIIRSIQAIFVFLVVLITYWIFF